MSKLSIIKNKLIKVLFVLSVLALALGFSYGLGKYFIDSVVKEYPVTKRVYKTVYYPVTIQKIRLEPLAVYTLQAGVFTELNGAKQFAAELTHDGLRPHITQSAPYKVLLFAAPSREEIEKYKEYSPEGTFIVNDILNESEIAVRADKKFWLEFIPEFSELFKQSLAVISENGNASDGEIYSAWLGLSVQLKEYAGQEKLYAEQMNTLAGDMEKLAEELKIHRSTVQSKGESAQALLQIKHDYDSLRQFVSKFD